MVAYEAVSPSDALVNLTMLQQPLGVDRVLGVCWTLWAEIRFYALFALCVVLPGATRRRVVLFCAGWTLAAAIAQAANEPLLDIVLMPEYAPFFIGGIGLYLVHRYRPRRDRLGHRAGQLADRPALRGRADCGTRRDPDRFSYRSSFGIVAVVTLRLRRRSRRSRWAGCAGRTGAG